MRPEILFKLFSPHTILSGIGPRTRLLTEKLTGPNIINLLWLLPQNIVRRPFYEEIKSAPKGEVVTLKAKILSHTAPYNRRQPYSVTCIVSGVNLNLIFFNGKKDYLRSILPIDEIRIVSGKLEFFREKYQITHPDYIVKEDAIDTICDVEPIYPLTSNLSNKVLRRYVDEALKLAPDLPEWLDESVLISKGWNGWKETLAEVHSPKKETDLISDSTARRRLAYDELLANQLALGLIRNQQKKRSGKVIKPDQKLRQLTLEHLPYELTKGQTDVIETIDKDLASEDKMLRLLQGDVGSGKTIVAFLTLLSAIEAGFQGALMAPTEILARQHYETLEPLAKKVGVTIDILTGKDAKSQRLAILENLENGSTNLLVGTHALFQGDVRFNNLGYAVIDEQHKFGVNQRLALGDKGAGSNILIMTATPIPRTLTMIAYGDLEISNLTSKLPGRIPIITKAISSKRIEEVIEAISRAVTQGARAYWICPLIEDNQANELVATEERFKYLQDVFKERVGLVHGRMKTSKKDIIMNRFRDGDIDILVSTTVVEVGVDVPEASIIVIEHAERFGLSQLHQLRGRVGRGKTSSTCLLLYQPPLSETARIRLQTIRDSDDGFMIAEQDLKLRGSGELLGTRQSGLPEMKIANLAVHFDLLELAKKDADYVLNSDPLLNSERGTALRTLLYLFERDTAVQYLNSG